MGSDSLIESLKYAPCIITSSNRVLHVGYSLVDITGYKKQDFISKEPGRVLNGLLKCRVSMSELRDPSDKKGPYYIFNKDGEARKVYIIINEISDTKRAVIFMEVEESRFEDRFQVINSLFNKNDIAMAVFDVNCFTIIKSNPVFTQLALMITGFRDVTGFRLDDIVKHFLESSGKDKLIKAMSLDKTAFIRNMVPGGKEAGNLNMDTLLFPLIENDTHNLSLVLLFQNEITVRDVAADMQKEKMLEVLNMLNVAYACLSIPNYSIIHLSREARLTLKSIFEDDIEINRCETRRLSLFKMLSRDARSKIWNGFIAATKDKTIQDIGELRLFRHEKAVYNVFIQPVLSQDGTPLELVIAVLKKKDEMLKEQTWGKSDGYSQDIVSFIAHEMKTPINVIFSAIQTMEAICENELTVKAHSYIKRIKQNANKQLRLVNSLLDISKAESGYMQVYRKNFDIVRLTRVIVESVRMYAWEKGIDMKFNTLLNSKIIAVDDEKYERIMLNLLSNAIKYTPSGNSIHINLSKARKKICLEVKDEGVGIPEDKINHIFKRFSQVENMLTKNESGTGIGLSLVKKLTSVMGWEISVESREGEGSSFRLYIPETNIDTLVSEDINECFNSSRLERQVSIEFSGIYLK